jgi:uncharacterized DUF497 family protein
VTGFEWDEGKDLLNFEKHEVFFLEAQTTWADFHGQEYFDVLHSVGEDRFLRIGHSSAGRLLTVVFTEREGRFRIISARCSTAAERKKYEEGI